MSERQGRIEKGALNLLANGAGTRKGDRLLILHEERGLGYYDDEIVGAVIDAATGMEAQVTVAQVPFEPQPAKMPDDVLALMQAADRTVFLARLGDQLRFHEMAPGKRVVVCYALDVDMLSSSYGTADHHAFVALKSAIDGMLGRAESIRVTCPKGTDFSGPGPGVAQALPDVGVQRFPMPVFTPIAAEKFSGTVVLPGFLVGTGSKYYRPYALEYEGPLSVAFEAGRIVGFRGSAAAIRAAEQHYRFVAEKFDIDGDCVHSWHAGVHPGCGFSGAAADSYERWSGAAFGNPRLLHFHTCGAYAPGEISWNVVDPTIVVDGIPVWQDGVLRPQFVPGGKEILAKYPDIAALFEEPVRGIGL